MFEKYRSTSPTGEEIDSSSIDEQTSGIFARLTERLGELEIADENALLAQDEDIDPAVLIFEEGVEGVLDSFEEKLQGLAIAELAEELTSTAQELVGFGMMADLNSFVELCESIQQQVSQISPSEIESLTKQALKTWRRSHALVLRGSFEKLPSALEGYEKNLPLTDGLDSEEFDPLAIEGLNLAGLQSAFETNTEADTKINTDSEEEFDPLAIEGLNLAGLQSAFETNTEADTKINTDSEEEFDPLAIEGLNLAGLQSAFETNTEADTNTALPETTKSSLPSPASSASPQVEKMVRVPMSQLKQFNTLFEQLVLKRNNISSRVASLQNIVGLMNQRMSQIERSNTQLRKWYDRASVEGLLNEGDRVGASATPMNTEQKIGGVAAMRFDTLEMDRYSDIHLICQEQLETIVQLQEVATDIQIGMQDVHQSVRDLHYTTKSMQGNVTRTQMLPFAEAVKRLPRVIRELNLQFDKQVTLKIVGETTLLDRSVIEALSDPLMHLLRNSFDHGIEDRETRIAAGKSESGTITIRAGNRGTFSVITISDDGGGISLDKICDRVCQMGVSRAEVKQIPEAELLNFIFEPGFSTAQKVTELSGRGVGMDVVRSNLQEVRGDVQVSTELGKGTTFTLKVPFAISILRVAIIEQGEFIFAIPANSIKELIPDTLESSTDESGIDRVNWQDEKIHLLKITEIFSFSRTPSIPQIAGEPTIDRGATLIVGDERSSAALQIDRFWNEQESTIRKIESPIELPASIISSVVFGDGKVIPLIDPLALTQETNNRLFQEDRLNSDSEVISYSDTKTILIVDDSINVRQYLSLTLERADYRVEQAKDGREAVDKLLEGLAVDAVICDLEMPRLGGYGVLEEIKARPEFADLPIAMLTSRSNEKHRKLAMNLGASAYFSKPFNEKELLDKLAEFTSLAIGN